MVWCLETDFYKKASFLWELVMGNALRLQQSYHLREPHYLAQSFGQAHLFFFYYGCKKSLVNLYCMNCNHKFIILKEIFMTLIQFKNKLKKKKIQKIRFDRKKKFYSFLYSKVLYLKNQILLIFILTTRGNCEHFLVFIQFSLCVDILLSLMR